MDKYNKKKSRDQVVQVYVTEFYTTKLTPAEDLYFVAGSDVMGPMGRELVPVMGKENAETFFKDHRGTKMIKYKEMTAEEIPKGR